MRKFLLALALCALGSTRAQAQTVDVQLTESATFTLMGPAQWHAQTFVPNHSTLVGVGFYLSPASNAALTGTIEFMLFDRAASESTVQLIAQGTQSYDFIDGAPMWIDQTGLTPTALTVGWTYWLYVRDVSSHGEGLRLHTTTGYPYGVAWVGTTSLADPVRFPTSTGDYAIRTWATTAVVVPEPATVMLLGAGLLTLLLFAQRRVRRT